MKLQKGEYYEITGSGFHKGYTDRDNEIVKPRKYYFKTIGKFINQNKTEVVMHLYKILKTKNIAFVHMPTNILFKKEIINIKHITKEKMMVMMI